MFICQHAVCEASKTNWRSWERLPQRDVGIIGISANDANYWMMHQSR